MFLLKFINKIFFFFVLCLGYARPPKDLILMPPLNSYGVKIIRDKNVTFTSEQPEFDESAKIKTLFDVKGRSRPNRSGSIVATVAVGTVVFPFRWSADGKWVAVRVDESGLKLWMPKTALPKMDQKFKLMGSGKTASSSAGKSANQESSVSDSDSETEEE